MGSRERGSGEKYPMSKGKPKEQSKTEYPRGSGKNIQYPVPHSRDPALRENIQYPRGNSRKKGSRISNVEHGISNIQVKTKGE
jgi:hypothetical protein